MWSHGVVVITSALHAEGPRFDPGWDHSELFPCTDSKYSMLITYLFDIALLSKPSWKGQKIFATCVRKNETQKKLTRNRTSFGSLVRGV